MSRNLSALSYRKGLDQNVFDRMVKAAEAEGTSETGEFAHRLGEESLFGDALSLGAVSFYDFLKKENAGKKVFLCNGSACLCAQTQDKLHASVARHFKSEEIGHICCLGRCHEGGAFQYQGKNYSGRGAAELDQLFTTGVGDAGDRYAVVSDLAAPLLTSTPLSLAETYAPLKPWLSRDRNELLAELRDSKLRGRGGAGFPLHLKWQSCRDAQGPVKYIVCNADEGDPGAYIDKYLMEQQPHLVLLGMMAAGWFCGANVGVLYIRAEYPDSIARMNAAVQELRDAGWLGKKIQGSAFSFDFKTIQGAGAYICGEETALLASIEGQRPEVRVRPPFPTQEGLYRKPTIVNNVETFANIRPILALGGKGYARIGTEQSSGPKLLSLDSHFRKPGIFEVAMGAPLSKVVYSLAGGFKNPIKAIQVGGPLGGLVPTDKIEALTVDFESFKNAGFLLGHAGIVSIPESMPMIEYIEHLFQFTADESCGKCFPCRLGSTRGQELVARARKGEGMIDRELVDDLLETMEQTSLCALGGGVPLPIKNALHYFADELRPFFQTANA
ncbi:MAG: formate dehydrogenase [Verrucomicrobia bacterium]|nr:formate dehydrogenase [Verrucomicrobiota bacterium]MBI3867552.1 formate dehydrogenase [Verrucomicrobiota bacterium]